MHLVLRQEQLICFHIHSKGIKPYPVEIPPNLTARGMVFVLSQSYLHLSEEGVISFSSAPSKVKKIDDCILWLSEKGSPKWVCRDLKRRITRSIPLDHAYLFNHGLKDHYTKFFEVADDWGLPVDPLQEVFVPLFVYGIDRMTPEERVTYVRDAEIEEIRMCKGEFSSVCIKKPIFQSQLGPKIYRPPNMCHHRH